MTAIETWLKQATRRLSAASTAQVRTEILEHYESAIETAPNAGATFEEAERQAVASMGSARMANRQYRKVLLTAAEDKMLCNLLRWEGRVLCSRSLCVWLVRLAPITVLAAASFSYTFGPNLIARMLLLAGVVISVLFTGPTLPIYTPLRARIFRYLKWPAIIVAIWFAVEQNTLMYWWSALTICSIGIAYTEWMRMSIRRKLPAAEWPKQLYL